MKPTNDDLARLIPDARREHDAAPPLDESPGPMAADAVDALKTLLLLVAAPAVKWHEVRALALQALYLCALIAWEAGRRMARTATTPRDVARAVILDHLRRFVGTGGGIAWKDVLDVAGAPADAMREAMRELVAEGLVTQSDDPITMYAPVRMFVNDGKGGLRPLGAPTAAETPAAKHDVDALLQEVERWLDGFGWHSDESVPAVRCRQIMRLLSYVAAALRAERERHEDTARCLGEAAAAEWQTRQAVDQAYGHLRAILDWGWPDGTTGPEPVRRARAFLAGEEQAPHRDDAREIELLRKELADKGVALERMVDRVKSARESLRQIFDAFEFGHGDITNAEDVRTVVSTASGVRRLANCVIQVAQDRQKEHEALFEERKAHTATRAKLATEDEAHAHTRAQLADAKGGLAAAGREVERLQGVTREALAAQNRAESEAASLRIEVTDLRRKMAEGDAMVDQLVVWAKKGRA